MKRRKQTAIRDYFRGYATTTEEVTLTRALPYGPVYLHQEPMVITRCRPNPDGSFTCRVVRRALKGEDHAHES